MFTHYQTHFNEDERIWYGNKVNQFFNYNVSIGQVLLHMLRRDHEKIIQISDNNGLRLRAVDILQLSICIARNLQDNGLNQNDVIGLIAENSHLVASLAIAAFLCGMPLNALDTEFNEDEIKHLFGLTKPKIVFCDENIYEKVENAIKKLSLNCEIYTIEEKINGVKSIHEFLKGYEEKDINDFVVPKLGKGGDQICAILCSSGSTGLPKGISVSHAMILQQPIRISQDNQIMLCFSPLHWISGFRTLISSIIYGSTRVITNRSFTPELALELIEKYQITYFMSSPTHMTLITECPDIKYRNLSSLKTYSCGGDQIPNELIEEMLKYMKNGKIIIVYGMSEIAGSCTNGNVKQIKQGSTGKIVNNFQIKIIDKNGMNLNKNQQGEIYVKPPYKLLGYYGNDVATKECIDEDGWYHTDDIGYFDDDNYLFLIDRRIDEIKYMNHYIWTSHLESALRKLPQVLDACAFGIRNLETTELPAAAVILKNDYKNEINEQMIFDNSAKYLKEYEQLKGGIYIYNAFPLTTSGKIKRRKIRNEVEKIYYEKQKTKLNKN